MVILFAIAGALAALALQRYVIIGATAFGGAWTVIVGGLALRGDRTAANAAARQQCLACLPDESGARASNGCCSPGSAWDSLGAIVQLAVTAKGK